MERPVSAKRLPPPVHRLREHAAIGRNNSPNVLVLSDRPERNCSVVPRVHNDDDDTPRVDPIVKSKPCFDLRKVVAKLRDPTVDIGDSKQLILGIDEQAGTRELTTFANSLNVKLCFVRYGRWSTK